MPRVEITITGIDPKETMISIERRTEEEAVAEALRLLAAFYALTIARLRTFMDIVKEKILDPTDGS